MPATTSPTVVLLPGMDGTGRLYDRLKEELEPGVPVQVVGYPADAPLAYDALVDRVVAALPDGPCVLFAESFSGPIGVRVVARGLPQVKALILCATFVRPPVPRGLARVGAMTAGVLPTTPPRFGVQALMTGSAPAVVRDVRHAMARVEPAVLQARIDAVATVDVRSDLTAVGVPVTYIRATRDRLVGTRSLQEIQALRPELEVVELDGPHLIAQVRPLRVAEVIRDVVGRLAP